MTPGERAERVRAATLLSTPRLGATRRRLLYALIAALLITGSVWLWLHYRTPEGSLPNPWEPWMMKLHGAAAMLLIYAAGTMLYGHMLIAWRQGRNRATGSIAAGAFLALALTGYGLYYFNGEGVRSATEWLHWIVGFAAPIAVAWHVVKGRR